MLRITRTSAASCEVFQALPYGAREREQACMQALGAASQQPCCSAARDGHPEGGAVGIPAMPQPLQQLAALARRWARRRGHIVMVSAGGLPPCVEACERTLHQHTRGAVQAVSVAGHELVPGMLAGVPPAGRDQREAAPGMGQRAGDSHPPHHRLQLVSRGDAGSDAQPVRQLVHGRLPVTQLVGCAVAAVAASLWRCCRHSVLFIGQTPPCVEAGACTARRLARTQARNGCITKLLGVGDVIVVGNQQPWRQHCRCCLLGHSNRAGFWEKQDDTQDAQSICSTVAAAIESVEHVMGCLSST